VRRVIAGCCLPATRGGHELIAAERLMLTGPTDCPVAQEDSEGGKYRMYQKTLVRHLNW
jgi:hypothetical protein